MATSTRGCGVWGVCLEPRKRGREPRSRGLGSAHFFPGDQQPEAPQGRACAAAETHSLLVRGHLVVANDPAQDLADHGFNPLLLLSPADPPPDAGPCLAGEPGASPEGTGKVRRA